MKLIDYVFFFLAMQGAHEEGGNHSRPSTLHLSPDLGIDSDAGRFSSLERSPGERNKHHTSSSWRLSSQSGNNINYKLCHLFTCYK